MNRLKCDQIKRLYIKHWLVFTVHNIQKFITYFNHFKITAQNLHEQKSLKSIKTYYGRKCWI